MMKAVTFDFDGCVFQIDLPPVLPRPRTLRTSSADQPLLMSRTTFRLRSVLSMISGGLVAAVSGGSDVTDCC